MRELYLLIVLGMFVSCERSKNIEKPNETDVPNIRYEILTTLPHDTGAFTEGLVIHHDKIFESTGYNGQSWISEVNPTSGVSDKKIILPQEYFGEGITILNNKIYQLTYTTKKGFVYDVVTYKKIRDFNYDPAIKQGWGLTHNGKQLILSDGTDKIHFMDTSNFNVVKSITVIHGQSKIAKINELEYIDNFIFANVWETSLIVKIDPATGKVVGVLDLSALTNEIERTHPHADVLNGIAYDKNSKALLVTGKYWPKSYLIRIHE